MPPEVPNEVPEVPGHFGALLRPFDEITAAGGEGFALHVALAVDLVFFFFTALFFVGLSLLSTL